MRLARGDKKGKAKAVCVNTLVSLRATTCETTRGARPLPPLPAPLSSLSLSKRRVPLTLTAGRGLA